VRRVLQAFEPYEGGVPEHVLQLSVGLRDRGWDVEVAAPAASPFVDRFTSAGLKVHRLPLRRRPGRADLVSARALRGLDRPDRFGIVHAHSSKAGVIARALLGGPSGRIVYSPHCFAFNRSGAGGRLLAWAVEQALVPRTGALVAVCDWERRQAGRTLLGASSRVKVIENGVEPCREAAPHEGLRDFADGGPLAGLVSRLEPQKDPVRLVQAFARAVGTGAPGKLAIVGNGSLADAVAAAIEREGLTGRAALFPFEPGGTASYLAALDLFVLTSRWESLPISMLETMACGVPVLAPAVGGVAEVLESGSNGVLVAPGDDTALADALGELLRDERLRREIGARGRALVEARFGSRRMVEETEAVYIDLLGRRQAQRGRE
jgi:glycosyltransferase involved in cell wall biosynthesis